MLYEVVKLRFNSPLFIARGKPGDESSEEIIHSDTLKAAIFSAALEAGFPVDENQTETHCPFLDAFDVSSAFPFIGEEYFFPKPQTGLPDIEDDTPSFNQHKEKKEIRYVGKSYFENIIRGDPHQTIAKNHKLFQVSTRNTPTFSRYVSDHPDAHRCQFLMLEEQTMRVSVPRWYDRDTDATPFYAERLHFHPEAGLYFFISFRNTNETIRGIIRQSIELLGDSGMGADRSSGNGTFIPKWSQLELETPQQSSHRIMLSLYCPKEEEARFVSNSAISSAYSLIKRGGWIARAEDERAGSLRKRSVYMIEEGAVLPNRNDGAYRGRLCNLRPSIGTEVGSVIHPVWRDGRAFSLPFIYPNKQP